MFAAEARSRPHLPLVPWGERNGNADGDHCNLAWFNDSLAFDGSMEVNPCSSTRLIGGDNSEGRKSFDGELGCGHTATVSSRRLWRLARLATKAGEAAAGHDKWLFAFWAEDAIKRANQCVGPWQRSGGRVV